MSDLEVCDVNESAFKQYRTDYLLPPFKAQLAGQYADAEIGFRAAVVEADRIAPQSLLSVTATLYLSETLYTLGRFDEVESIALHALNLLKQLKHEDTPLYSAALTTLGRIQFVIRGKLDSAERLLLDALVIDEKHFGVDHARIGALIDTLGQVCFHQSRYAEAEQWWQRAMSIWERLGPNYRGLATTLERMATIHRVFNRSRLEGDCLRKALETAEKGVDGKHPSLAYPLSTLGDYYLRSQPPAEREALVCFRRAYRLLAPAIGREHPDLLVSLDGLAEVAKRRGRFHRANQLLRRGLRIVESTYGRNHQSYADSLMKLAGVAFEQEHEDRAESLIREALVIVERAKGPQHSQVGIVLGNLAKLLRLQKRFTEAEPLYQRALKIRAHLASDVPQSTKMLEDYAELLREVGRDQEAKQLLAQPRNAKGRQKP